jgi:hypothetical protein
VHDREWWGLVAVALEIMIAAGIIERPAAETAVEYHRNRRGCVAVEIEPRRLARLRALMVDGVSLERAWHELCDF